MLFKTNVLDICSVTSHRPGFVRHCYDERETVEENDFLADRFEAYRPHLKAVAYRMLGSLSEADDAVQEAWLRLGASDAGDIANLGGWLTTVVGRVCLDMLRSRTSRREEPLGVHVPDPIITDVDGADPEHEALLADSVGLALLVVLQTLAPAERLAFVLHDMFAVPFDEIANVLDRTEVATRQLASRARRRVRGATPRSDPDLREQRRVVDAFLAASRAGDFGALLDVLDPDVVFRIDTGPATSREAVIGAHDVALRILARGSRMAPHARPAIVNGNAGVVVVPRTHPVAVVAFAIEHGRVVELDLIADPAKLRRVRMGTTE
jgi:RNA polymerase sigma factor (sigma-70 family)